MSTTFEPAQENRSTRIEVMIWAIMAFSPMSSLIQYRMKNQAEWNSEKPDRSLGNQIAKQCLSNSGCGCLSPTCGHVCDARILANSGHGWGQCTHPLRHCARFFLCPRLGPQIWHRIRSCWDWSHCARYDLIRAPPTRCILLWIPEQRNFHFLQSGVQTRNTHDHLAGHGLTACSESKTH